MAQTVVLITATGPGAVVVPAGVTSAFVECWGGGGRKGGAYAYRTITTTPGETISYTVGAGGVGTAYGGMTSGGATSFASDGRLVSAQGGGTDNTTTQATWTAGDGGHEGGGAYNSAGGGGSAGPAGDGIGSSGNNGGPGNLYNTTAGSTNGVSNVAGGSGGSYSNYTNYNGGAPGGGYARGDSYSTASGGRGQIRITYAEPVPEPITGSLNRTLSGLSLDSSVTIVDPPTEEEITGGTLSATNYALWSSDFSNPVWVSYGSLTKTVNAALAPDGTMSAVRLQMNVANQQLLQQYVPLVGRPGMTHTISAWVRSASGTQNLALRSGQTGANKLFAVNTKWQRISWTVTSTNYNTEVLQFTNGSLVVGGSNNLDIYLWGVQVEQGSAATAYIPTKGEIVTRSGISLGRLKAPANLVAKDFQNEWSHDNTTVEYGFEAPDGSMTAFRVETNHGYNILVDPGKTVSGKVTFTVYAKVGDDGAAYSGNTYGFYDNTAGQNLYFIGLSYTSGVAVTTYGEGQATVTPAGGDWWKLDMTVQVPEGHTISTYAGLGGGWVDGAAPYSHYVWNPSLTKANSADVMVTASTPDLRPFYTDNFDFNAWADGAVVPDTFAQTAGGGVHSKVPGRYGNAIRGAASPGDLLAFITSEGNMVPGGEWLVLEAEVTLVEGSLGGSGLTFNHRSSVLGNLSTFHFPFRSTPDVNGEIHEMGEVGRTYEFVILFDARYPDSNQYRIYGYTNRGNYGSLDYHVIDWHMTGFRPARPDEIAAGVASRKESLKAPSVSGSVDVPLTGSLNASLGRLNRRLLLPERYDGVSQFFTNTPSGSPATVPDYPSNAIEPGFGAVRDIIHTAASQQTDFASRATVPATPGRTYKLEVEFQQIAATGTPTTSTRLLPCIRFLDADNVGGFGTGSVFTGFTGGVQTCSQLFSDVARPGVLAWPEGTVNLRPYLRIQNGPLTAQTVRIRRFSFTDVTATMTADVVVSGTLDKTLQNPTLNAGGTSHIRGEAQISLQGLTSNGDGQVAVEGAAALVLPPMSATGAGSVDISAQLVSLLAPMAFAGAIELGPIQIDPTPERTRAAGGDGRLIVALAEQRSAASANEPRTVNTIEESRIAAPTN